MYAVDRSVGFVAVALALATGFASGHRDKTGTNRETRNDTISQSVMGKALARSIVYPAERTGFFQRVFHKSQARFDLRHKGLQALSLQT